MTGHRPIVHRVLGDPSRHQPESWADQPRVASVVVAIYNAEQYLERLISQLSALDHTSFEVILVDDGSQDATISRIEAIKTLPFPLLVLALQKNYGVAAARNLALNHVNGDFVWMVDGDDSWEATALSTLCEAAVETNADLVIAQATRVIAGSGRRSRIPAPSQPGMLNRDQLIAAYLSGDVQGQLWNKLFARHLIVGNGDVFPRMPSKSDVCGLIPVIDRTDSAVVIPNDVYTYEFHSGSIATSKAKPLDLLRVAELSYRQFGTAPSADVLLKTFWVRSIAIPLLTEVWRFGDRSEASRLSVKVVKSNLGFRTAVALARKAQLNNAIWAVALKYFSAVVRRVYVSRRQSEWL